jgi:hypothetical protein
MDRYTKCVPDDSDTQFKQKRGLVMDSRMIGEDNLPWLQFTDRSMIAHG